MNRSFIMNANIVNENKIFAGDVIIENGIIMEVIPSEKKNIAALINKNDKVMDARNKFLFPGVIDCHVHFREPGLTYKADIHTESKAAVAGGVTSYFEMPNTVPNTTTIELVEEKNLIASKKSLANYAFFIGGNNNNASELLSVNKKKICGIKLFLGSSTGDMLADDMAFLDKIFANAVVPLTVHCENDEIINNNIQHYKYLHGENAPFSIHPHVRTEEACYVSSEFAVALAKKYNTRLHLTHISTAAELNLVDNTTNIEKKKITAETCPHYLWFDQHDYYEKEGFIKCNPSVKTESDKMALLNGILNNTIDIITTDHAPHTLEEKKNKYFSCPSGIASIEHALLKMLEFYYQRKISLEQLADKMCHSPALCYNIEKRGFIREGYWADIVLLDLNIMPEIIPPVYSKCGWSPYQEQKFKSKITHTFVNGNLVFENDSFPDFISGKALLFDR